MSSKKSKTSNIVFRPGFRIGEIDAKYDDEFLKECYIENPEQLFLLDSTRREVILDGRTGAGKTAAFRKACIEAPENVVLLSPQDLFIDGLGRWANSDFLRSAGVNIEPVYKNIWLGMFAIEVIRHRFPEDETSGESIWVKIRRVFSQKEQKKNEQLLKKLREWGDGFSDPPEVRLRKITQKVDKKLEAELAAKTQVLNGKAKFAEGESETLEFVADDDERQKLQRLISDISASEVRDIIKVLEEVHRRFDKTTVILIDDLDLPWASATTRMTMVKALIDAACQINARPHLRCALSIRDDLFQLVLEEVSKTGQQREKYKQFRRIISWKKEQLVELVNKRIQTAFKRQYTKRSVSFADVFPKNHGQRPTLDFLLSRTLYRPRDIIELVNQCIEKSEGRTDVSAKTIGNVVGEFSSWLRESVEDEWRGVYGDIPRTYPALQSLKRPKWTFREMVEFNWYDTCLKDVPEETDRISEALKQGLEGKIDVHTMAFHVLNAWYEVGFVGVGYGKDGRIEYRFIDGGPLSLPRLSDNTKIQISPPFEGAFG